MTARYVTLGDGRKIGLGRYVAAWRATLAAPDNARFAGSPRDPRHPCDRATVLREFREGMDDRINRSLPYYGHGRKWDVDWYWAMWRASRELNNPRLVIRYLPTEIRSRFAHRIERFD